MSRFIIRKALKNKFRDCPQFAGNPIQGEDHISCEFHLSSHLYRFFFEHGWLAFLHAYASTLHLLYPFASSYTCYIDDSNSSRYNTREISKRRRPRKAPRLWERCLQFGIGHNTIFYWGSLWEQSSSIQGNCYKRQLKNTSSMPIARCNHCKICWNSYNRLPRRLKLARRNKQHKRLPTTKLTSPVQNSWLKLKIPQPWIRIFWVDVLPSSSVISTPLNQSLMKLKGEQKWFNSFHFAMFTFSRETDFVLSRERLLNARLTKMEQRLF